MKDEAPTPSTPPRTPTDLRAALREADWEALLPTLLAYAARRLRRAGWGAGRDDEASRLSVEQIVQTAVEHCLDGTRTWDPSNVDLAGFLRGVIRSLTSSERKKYVRAKTFASDEVVERNAKPVDSAEHEAIEEEGRRTILAAVEECARGDADLEMLLLAIQDDHIKREDLAETLGWDPARVTAARIKLQRRLVRHSPEQFTPMLQKRRNVS